MPPCAGAKPRNDLIRSFDDVLTNYFDCLATLRFQVLPGCRFKPCLRLLQAVPFANTYTLGSRPHVCNNLSSRAEAPATGGLLRGLNSRAIRSSGSGIDDLALADEVSFRLGLSVQPLHGRCAERGARNDGQREFELRIHYTFLPVGRMRSSDR